MLTITSNNHYRPAMTWHDLTPTEREGFEYAMPDVDEYGASDYSEYRFIRAYGDVVDLYEFESISRGISVPVVAPLEGERDLLANWQGIQPGSTWHAIVMRYDDNGDVCTGWAYWG